MKMRKWLPIMLAATMLLSACSTKESTKKNTKKSKDKEPVESTEFEGETSIFGGMFVVTGDSKNTEPEKSSKPEESTVPSESTTTSETETVPFDPSVKKVGISMPTESLQRWNSDGNRMKSYLEVLGYEVDLQFAGNDIATQNSQIQSMIDNGCDALVIASIDGAALSQVLSIAKEKNIGVFAYDRMIYDSDAVSYYSTFDNYYVGCLQGEYIRDNLKLDSTDGPYYMEIFAGDPSDSNAALFYCGAMDVLRPYIDSGKLVVRSGQTEFSDVATSAWRSENAQSRMETILAGYYANGEVLDAVLCSNDTTALGVTYALGTCYTGTYPIITGQDCDLINVRNILEGKQSMSIFKETYVLADRTVTMVSLYLDGGEVPVNDTTTYNNGAKTIPAFLVESTVVDINNYHEILIDTGYYSEDDL